MPTQKELIALKEFRAKLVNVCQRVADEYERRAKQAHERQDYVGENQFKDRQIGALQCCIAVEELDAQIKDAK